MSRPSHEHSSQQLESELSKYGSTEIRVVEFNYFIQIVSTNPPSKLEVLNKFRQIEGLDVSIRTLEVFRTEQESFVRRARLGTIASRIGGGGLYTTTVGGGDAYIKMREIDVSYLDFASHISNPRSQNLP